MADTTIIQFKDVTKRYDDQTVLDQVSFEIERGKFYTLLGPSGCGKTTILRLIAGFSEATEGDIIFNGKRINDVPANKRQVNTVFQDYALFPHLNVFENIAFGLRIKKVKEADIAKRVTDALKFVNLSGYEKREITEMSGGQRQRVAIARAIVNDPSIVIADEPTGNLDSKMGAEVMELLHKLNKEDGRTIVMVTHNDEQAKQTSRTVRFFDGRQVM